MLFVFAEWFILRRILNIGLHGGTKNRRGTVVAFCVQWQFFHVIKKIAIGMMLCEGISFVSGREIFK